MRIRYLLSFLLISVPGIGKAQDTALLDKSLPRFERKKQDAFIREYIVGKWKDQNATLYFFPGGKSLTVYDDSTKINGFWEIKNGKILFIERPSYEVISYDILYFSKTQMKYQLSETYQDPTIWSAVKVGKFKK